MKTFAVSSNFYTMVTVIATLVALVYLFDVKPDAAPIFMAAALPFVVGIVGQLQQSKHNTEKIEKLDAKVDVNTNVTETTHRIVNSQRTAMEQKIDALQATVTRLIADRAAASVEVAHAQGSEQRIISAIEASAIAPTGSTPPHGTKTPG